MFGDMSEKEMRFSTEATGCCLIKITDHCHLYRLGLINTTVLQ